MPKKIQEKTMIDTLNGGFAKAIICTFAILGNFESSSSVLSLSLYNHQSKKAHSSRRQATPQHYTKWKKEDYSSLSSLFSFVVPQTTTTTTADSASASSTTRRNILAWIGMTSLFSDSVTSHALINDQVGRDNNGNYYYNDNDVALLGPLAPLVGTWIGNQGLNIVAVPSRKSKPDDMGRFELIVQPYMEVLTFTKIPDSVRNRGGDLEQFVGALEYKQEVYTLENGSSSSSIDSAQENRAPELIHVENGMFFYLGNIQKYDDTLTTATTNNNIFDAAASSSGRGDSSNSYNTPQYNIARSATIPHGNSAMLFGTTSNIVGRPPIIPTISSLPRNIGSKAPPEYNNPYQKPIDIVNPNALLQEIILKQEKDIQKTVHFSLDSQNEGSSVTSVPFLMDRADTTRFSSDFWLETMRDGSLQLQYSQSIDIAFHKPIEGRKSATSTTTTSSGSSSSKSSGSNSDQDKTQPDTGFIQWPHVTVNTLTKVKG